MDRIFINDVDGGLLDTDFQTIDVIKLTVIIIYSVAAIFGDEEERLYASLTVYNSCKYKTYCVIYSLF